MIFFFKPALADRLSLEFEWQQVSLDLKDSSHYSADHNNAVMVLVCNPISDSSSPLPKHVGIVQSAPITIGITVTCMFLFFLVLWQVLSICLHLRFVLFSLSVLPDGKVHNLPCSLYLFIHSFDNNQIWSPGWD